MAHRPQSGAWRGRGAGCAEMFFDAEFCNHPRQECWAFMAVKQSASCWSKREVT